MITEFNILPVHLANFGQHDFDFGPDHTRSLIQQSGFTWFSSNLKSPDGKPFANVPIFRVVSSSQTKIGFIALTAAMSTTMPSAQVIQTDPLKAAAYTLSELQMENPDLIVALTQMSAEKNEQLLRRFQNISLVLSEERYEDKSTVVYFGTRPLITPCGNMGSLIQIDIVKEVDNYKFEIQVHPIDQTVEENPKMLQFQRKYQDSLETKLSEPLATVISPLDAGINTDFACRWKETTIGNLISDAYRWYHQANVAVINGGGIRANIPSGIMTLKNAYATLPFANRIALVRVDGLTIQQMLEHGVKSVEKKDGSFLHVAGAAYQYDPSQIPGQRVDAIKIQDEPLEPQRLYRLALPDFILKGGNQFDMLKIVEVLIPPEEAEIDVNILVRFVRQLSTIDYRLEQRIQKP